jgi:cation:H+ antiporter
MVITVKKQKPEESREQSGNNGPQTIKMSKAITLVAAGLLGVNFGAKFVVDGAVETAETLGVSQAMIGLTIVALGTSLPELVTSVMAALKKNADIAVGNVVGSNIFNIFLILGLSASIKPLPFSSQMNMDLMIVIVASAILFLSMFTGRKRNLLERPEGAIFLILYVAYIIFTIIRG